MHPLLAAILAAPEGDLSHHAVYADELQTAGDPRGELIAIELALAAAPTRTDLLARRAELRATHGTTWWPGIPTQHVRTRRGFVEAVAVAADHVDRAALLARTEPLRSLELVGRVPPEVFARLPPVDELVVHEIDDAGMQALCAAPCAETLGALDISGSPHIVTFSPGARLPACRRLAIAATWIEGYSVLAWDHVGELRVLDISLPRDRDFEVERVVARTPKLEELRASAIQDFMTLSVRTALARLPVLARLEAYLPFPSAQNDADALRDALPNTDVRLDVPTRVPLQLVADELAFDAAGEAYRNGQRVPLHIRYTQAFSVTYGTQVLQDAPVPTRLLIDAIACRGPRILTATGCKVEAALLPYDNRVTAELEIHDTHVDLDLEHYID